MDDDDEFGDLYTDVLRPISSALSPTPQIPPPPTTTTTTTTTTTNPVPDLNLEEDFIFEAPDPKFDNPTSQTQPFDLPNPKENTVSDPNLTQNYPVGEQEQEISSKIVDSPRVLENKSGFDGIRVLDEKGESFVKEEVEFDDLDGEVGEPLIPGLSTENFDGVGEEEEKEDDWDSDSEDDIHIVLNEKSGGGGGGGAGRMDGNVGDEDEDGEDFLLGDPMMSHQPIEEQDWGDELPQAGPEGERKEPGDAANAAAKLNGGVANAVGARVGYSNHVYQQQHHSQFKYVRPGAAVVPGGAIVGPGGGPSQVRPFVNIGPMAGRGRGDWRSIGVRPGPPMPRPFNSGFGVPVWANNSAGRGFGSGLDFTLPSHKSVFDIDIDSFEEKPWRYPGIDVSDFFNFGLDEENWKDYCKQLEQLRLEATMQSKIRVYESGRSEQDYDPDLPPELAAASGMHDAPVENAHLGKTDGGPTDPMGQGGVGHARPPIPTGRAIQVEGGFGERLPSIDTRPPRMRDSDAIIEIILQDSMDDDPVTSNNDLEQADNDLQRDDVKGGKDEDNGKAEYDNRFPRKYDGRKREMVGKGPLIDSVHDDIHVIDGVLPIPPEAPVKSISGSKGRGPSYYHDRRLPRGTSRDRYSRPTAENDDDVIPCQNAQVDEDHDSRRSKSGESIDSEHDPETSSLAAVEAAKDPSLDHAVDIENELELADTTAVAEGKEEAIDMIVPSDTSRDRSPLLPIKKQKLSSRVEQPAGQDTGSGDDLIAARSSDNSKARSGSSRDYQKRPDGGEEEVVQERRSRRVGDIKRRHDDDQLIFQRKDDYNREGRQEMDRNPMFVKGREDSQLSYPYRERDPSSTHPLRVKPGENVRPRERDSSVGARLRRDDETHGRRVKNEETRKRERTEELGSRQRSKVRESERGEKDEHFQSRKRLENGDWRGHPDKDMIPRQRERDDVSMIRHENFDDPHTKRRKDEEYHRREQAEKDILHGYRAREDTTKRKRERDDSLEQRRREDQARVREKPDDSHSVRHREENWRLRERDDRRLKQSHEDMQSTRERDGRGSVRSGRDPEDKSWVVNTRSKDEPKGLGSDKEYPFKDKRRQSEHSKRSDRAEDDSFPPHRGRDSVYARENQFGYEDRNPRHERSSTHSDRPLNASENQYRERHRDNRRNKDLDGVDQGILGASKRKQEDHSAHRSEKVKVASESGNVLISGPVNSRDPGQSRLSSSASFSKKNTRENDVLQQRHSSKKHREDAPSDEEQNSRRGRSKLERWTSHKDRDENTKALPTSKAKETSKNISDPFLTNEQPDEPLVIVESIECQQATGEDRSVHDSEVKDADMEPTSGSRHVEADKVGDDRHLDTAAKLKKRSERFKTPMPTEKEATPIKKIDNEALVSTQTENALDAEVKPERPARKRRWIGS